MILISIGLGNFLIICIAILWGGAIFKLVKNGASIILILLPIALITAGIGIVLSIFAVSFRCGLYILIMRQFFGGLPKEMEEAAMKTNEEVIQKYQ